MSKRAEIIAVVLFLIVGVVVGLNIDGILARWRIKADSANAEQPLPVSANAVKLDLHVMSQCPYGVQAETAFKDVVAKFGQDLDFKVEYIGNPGEALGSMHGANEVTGDIVQACAMKYAPRKAFDFILCQGKNFKEVATNGEACAKELSMPWSKISACASAQEGKDLVAASFKRSQEKGAHGSPTIFVNGKKYEGGRKPIQFMRAICAAADNKLAACSTIPTPPQVNATILTDKRCGGPCEPASVEGQIRMGVANPVISTLDYGTPEGKKLFETVKPSGLPAIVFDQTLDGDKEAASAFGRGLKEGGGHKFVAMGEWSPQCVDDGGCMLEACKASLNCRTEAPKQLDVFVMSQCPFGVRGLDATKEVFENFTKAGEAVDFRVHFIGDGDEKSLSSMHGQGEVDEDIREVCAVKHYAAKRKYLDYIWCRNKNVKDANWESCTGGTTGIDTAVIKKCFEGDEGKQLLAKSFEESKAAKISASPTWLVNNKYKFSGVDPETIKTNLCNHNKLGGCDAKLSGPAPRPGAGGAGAAAQPAAACGG